MAYDEDLANRVRELMADIAVTEKRMFGGLTFLINGNMSVNVSRKGGLMLRCEPAATEKLRGRAHAGPIVMRGRVTDGWVWIALEGLRTKRQLERWVLPAIAYAQSLPAKG
jgi:TfoX/Sxy family transcriptional regulator of competence genes